MLCFSKKDVSLVFINFSNILNKAIMKLDDNLKLSLLSKNAKIKRESEEVA